MSNYKFFMFYSLALGICVWLFVIALRLGQLVMLLGGPESPLGHVLK